MTRFGRLIPAIDVKPFVTGQKNDYLHPQSAYCPREDPGAARLAGTD